MKINKDKIERKLPKNRKDLPKEEVMIQQLKQWKNINPKVYKRIVKMLKKKFPDKEFLD